MAAAGLSAIDFPAVTESDEQDFIPRHIESVDDPVVTYAKAKFAATGHAIVRERFETTADVGDLREDKFPHVGRNPAERGVELVGKDLRRPARHDLWLHGPRTPFCQICISTFDGSKKLRRHLPLILDPLFQPLAHFLGFIPAQLGDRGFDLGYGAHGVTMHTLGCVVNAVEILQLPDCSVPHNPLL